MKIKPLPKTHARLACLKISALCYCCLLPHILAGESTNWEPCHILSLCCHILRSARWRHFTDAAVLFCSCNSSSIVFFETNLDTIYVCFPSLLSRGSSQFSLSLSSPPSQSLHPNPSLVCMCAYEPITGMEKPQIVHSKRGKDLMNFCVVLWL